MFFFFFFNKGKKT